MPDQNGRPTKADFIDGPTAHSLYLEAKALYTEGRQFRVVREGARLEGIVYLTEKQWSGWSRNLRVGEIVTCKGWRLGWGADPDQEWPFIVADFTADRVPHGADLVQVWPLAGLFAPYPLEGLLEPVDAEGVGA